MYMSIWNKITFIWFDYYGSNSSLPIFWVTYGSCNKEQIKLSVSNLSETILI